MLYQYTAKQMFDLLQTLHEDGLGSNQAFLNTRPGHWRYVQIDLLNQGDRREYSLTASAADGDGWFHVAAYRLTAVSQNTFEGPFDDMTLYGFCEQSGDGSAPTEQFIRQWYWTMQLQHDHYIAKGTAGADARAN